MWRLHELRVYCHSASVESSDGETGREIQLQASCSGAVCEDQLYKGLQQLRPGPGQSLGPGERVAAQGEELAARHSGLVAVNLVSSCVQTSFIC